MHFLNQMQHPKTVTFFAHFLSYSPTFFLQTEFVKLCIMCSKDVSSDFKRQPIYVVNNMLIEEKKILLNTYNRSPSCSVKKIINIQTKQNYISADGSILLRL